jgi:hypothetical protein
MKRAMQRSKLSLIIALVAIMLAGSLQAVYANSITSNTTLPDFLLRYAQYLSKGNTTELNIIINQMITQEQIKQDRIASTHRAVLQFPLSSSQLSSATESPMTTTYTYSWMSAIYGYSPPTYDIVTGDMVGEIQYPTNLVGQPDGSYALLWTDGWNENYSNPIGGEAMANGPVWNGYNGVASGDVYICAYTGIPDWQNDVMIAYSSNGVNWYWLGYAAVSNTSPQWVYIGYTPSEFTLISVVCWTPPPAPKPYSPLIKNYVWIDSVAIVSG